MTTDHDEAVGTRLRGDPRQRVRRALRRLDAHPRAGMAIRAAAAASISWGLVHVLPGFAAEYPYYAPLGAVIATSTTIAGSARQSWQAIAAIGLGALVALGIKALLGQNLATIAAVVGIGVLLGGWGRLGSGAAWLPTSALFVLIVGNEHPLDYVAGFAGLTLLGALVGLAVVAAVPPLPVTPADQALDRLRTALADHLEELEERLRQEGSPPLTDWHARVDALDDVVAAARQAVGRAQDARRGNRFARTFQSRLRHQRRRGEALQRLAFLVASITQLLSRTGEPGRDEAELPPSLRIPVAGALGGLAGALRATGGRTPDEAAVRRACDALRSLAAEHRRARARTGDDLLVTSGLVEDIRRSLLALHPRDDREVATR
ncbi:FUSC family protein [Blastococcus sp. SYSU DS0541]